MMMSSLGNVKMHNLLPKGRGGVQEDNKRNNKYRNHFIFNIEHAISQTFD